MAALAPARPTGELRGAPPFPHPPPMRAPEILVATSSDFALLRGGRPVAGGAWDDVVHLRASAGDAPPGAVRLVLRLRDGAEFVARDDAPGWDDFVDAAESALPGMPPRRAWWPGVAAAGGSGVVLFGAAAR
jgi:hypothetical protein